MKSNPPQRECCEKCWNSKYALTGKNKARFGCGVTCVCHWNKNWAHCKECTSYLNDEGKAECVKSDCDCHTPPQANQTWGNGASWADAPQQESEYEKAEQMHEQMADASTAARFKINQFVEHPKREQEIECICKENLAAKECPIHFPKTEQDRQAKFEAGAQDFNDRFLPVMKELAEEALTKHALNEFAVELKETEQAKVDRSASDVSTPQQKFIVTQVGDNPPTVTKYGEPTDASWEERLETLLREIGAVVPNTGGKKTLTLEGIAPLKAFIRKVREECYEEGRDDEAIDHTTKDLNAYEEGYQRAVQVTNDAEQFGFKQGIIEGRRRTVKKLVEYMRGLVFKDKDGKDSIDYDKLEAFLLEAASREEKI